MPRPALSFILPCLGDPAPAVEWGRLARENLRNSAKEIEIIVVAVAEGGDLHPGIEGGDLHPGIEGGDLPPGMEGGDFRRLKEDGFQLLQHPEPSRGGQLRAGAEVAQGELLVFQHPDNPLDKAHLDSLLRAAGNPEIPGGAFHRDFLRCWPGLRIFASLAPRWERRFGILYGDQSCFVRREVYEKIGGMPDMPLMEDVEFSRRLRAHGEVRFLSPPVAPDFSKFECEGRVRRKARNLGILWAYRLGVSPERLYRWYYG